MDPIEYIFAEAGGRFMQPAADLRERLSHIRAFVFDWDGVFNTGAKGDGATSLFSETDSMGTNLLRFGYWLVHGTLPLTVIISGQSNSSAHQFAEREHLDRVYSGFKNKTEALDHLLREHSLNAQQIAFTFDDVLDLSIASICGLRMLVHTPASALFTRYVTNRNHCDYITGQRGGDHAVREICELILGLLDKYDEVVDHRLRFSEQYSRYFSQRQAVETRFLRHSESGPLEGLEERDS